jgi:serine protease Do
MFRSKYTLIWLGLLILMLPVALVAFGASTIVWERGWEHMMGTNPVPVVARAESPKVPSAAIGVLQPSFAAILKPAEAAVVNVSSSRIVKTDESEMAPFLSDPFFRQFFGDQFNVPKERREQSLGSGVIVSPDGYILTNNHVVDQATTVKVFLPDKRELPAKVVGTDPKTDIAVLKINGTGFPVLSLGDSSKTQVGDLVFAIGNPFGVGETATMGIVSATGRANLGIEDYEDFIQTDAAINPGNSGGALVNAAGQVVGINTAILSRSGGSQGIGFAIPINMARQVMNQIVKNGKVIRGWVGLSIQDVTPAIAKAFGLKENQGVLIGDVLSNGPAAQAGLQTGDVILSMNGEAVTDTHTFRLKVASLAPGTEVRLKVLRKGSEIEVPVKLGEMPADKSEKLGDSAGQSSAMEGVVLDELTPEARHDLNLPDSTKGVVIVQVDPGTPAADAGLQRGDVIQEVNKKPVTSVRQFEDAVRAAGQAPILLLVNRAGSTAFVVVESK